MDVEYRDIYEGICQVDFLCRMKEVKMTIFLGLGYVIYGARIYLCCTLKT